MFVLPNVFLPHSSLLFSAEGRACVIVRCYDSQNRAVLDYFQVLSTVNFLKLIPNRVPNSLIGRNLLSSFTCSTTSGSQSIPTSTT